MHGLNKRLWRLIIHVILQVIVVSGETGCGKTTQLPQYILESEIEAARGAVCSIICTQPRRISAMSVSERVAAERGEKLGESVSFVADLMTCFKNLSLSIIFISRWTFNAPPPFPINLSF
jgi:HrpA-like RNA helicase